MSLLAFPMRAEKSASNSYVMNCKTIMLIGEYEESEYVIFLTNFADKTMSLYVVDDDNEVIHSLKLQCDYECNGNFQAIGVDNNSQTEYDVTLVTDDENLFVLIFEKDPTELIFESRTNTKNSSPKIGVNEFSLGFLSSIPEPYRKATIKQIRNKLKKYFPKL